jgi:hypothetical protein
MVQSHHVTAEKLVTGKSTVADLMIIVGWESVLRRRWCKAPLLGVHDFGRRPSLLLPAPFSA